MTRALVPVRILGQILLVILLRVPPLFCGENLRDDLAAPPLLVGLFRDFLGDLLLLFIMIKNAGAVLRPAVGPLLIELSCVMHFVEELEDLGVGYLGGVVDEERRFCVPGIPAADRLVGWIFSVAANVADAGVVEAALGAKVLAVHVFDAPEAAGGYGRALGALRDG